MQLDDFEGSEKAITKAYSLTPQDPMVLVNFAVVMDARGKRQRVADLLAELNDILTTVGAPPEYNAEVT